MCIFANRVDDDVFCAVCVFDDDDDAFILLVKFIIKYIKYKKENSFYKCAAWTVFVRVHSTSLQVVLLYPI